MNSVPQGASEAIPEAVRSIVVSMTVKNLRTCYRAHPPAHDPDTIRETANADLSCGRFLPLSVSQFRMQRISYGKES
jgi:hypothetical protein